MNNKKNNSALNLSVLVKRNISLFLKDKTTVIFSLLAPIIILLIYVLFLGRIQADSVKAIIEPTGIDVDPKLISGFINNWMIAGVMGVSCITVAFNACSIMVRDRERGMVNDVLSAPVKRWVIFASYVLSCFLITFIINALVLLVGVIYLACTGGMMMSFVDFLAIFGITILSIFSSSTIAVFITSFFRTESALGASIGIMSAVIGFITGAYMPLSIMPEGLQYFVCFIPGSYSAGLFRNYFLRGPLELFLGALPDEFVNQLMSSYSVEMKFFGHTISAGWMAFALGLSCVLFASILVIFYSKKKSNLFLQRHKKKKR